MLVLVDLAREYETLPFTALASSGGDGRAAGKTLLVAGGSLADIVGKIGKVRVGTVAGRA